MRSIVSLALAAALSIPAVPVFADDEAPSMGAVIDARITTVEGEVTVYSPGDKDGVPATSGMPVEPGDRVVTAAESRAEIAMDADSIIELEGGTDFTVTSLERKQSSFALAVGSLLAKVQDLLKGGGAMRITSPNAVAAVRGTEFAVEQEAGDGPSHVAVFDEGKVAVSDPRAAGPEALLGPNQELSVPKGANFATVTPMALQRFRMRRARIEMMRQRRKNLRRAWKNLTPEQRQKLRQQFIDRQRKLRERIRRQRRELKRERRQERRERRRGE
ncbi:MAG: FecR domain-containing protein [Elusimicrobia bacterium]|nr:FecR domain-containing protein [Elusimicrobiota bacterium]